MCSISGFYNPNEQLLSDQEHWWELLKAMGQAGARRGPDDSGVWLGGHAGFAHTRLSIVDLATGHQPMIKTIAGRTAAIIYNGELYNTDDLRRDLKKRGCSFSTTSDTEVILAGFMEYGPDFVKQLNGIFAFAVADSKENALYLFRDRAGVKPCFFMEHQGGLVFASEPKGIFAYPGIVPTVDWQGLNEIFSLGPARTSGCGIFKGLHEVLPGHMLLCNPSGIHQTAYWRLTSHPHEDSLERTVEKTSFLLTDSISRQMVSDVPICTFLSGGVDSSLVSAICAGKLREKGQQLSTYSFDFTDNEKFFEPNAFQPSQDKPYAEQMAAYLGTDHHFLECSHLQLAELLNASVLAHDLPAMGDIDASLLHFCSLVRERHKVTLTGECADEIFGGYPWFHRKECFEAHTFPWTMDLTARKALLNEDFLQFLDMDSYVRNAYEQSVSETPALAEDSPQEARRRQIAWLNLRWFMQTLLNRMDRTSMYSGLEARVPFADHRIIEYLWNVPWSMKARDGVVKGLLRQAGKGLLPDDILFRRKSPYPKTYHRGYEALLVKQVREVADGNGPVMEFLDPGKLERFLSCPSDYGKPWYGQLMAGPQMLAYILQVNFWLEHYGVRVER